MTFKCECLELHLNAFKVLVLIFRYLHIECAPDIYYIYMLYRNLIHYDISVICDVSVMIVVFDVVVRSLFLLLACCSNFLKESIFVMSVTNQSLQCFAPKMWNSIMHRVY